jgi:hypothetical protein
MTEIVMSPERQPSLPMTVMLAMGALLVVLIVAMLFAVS